jgi:hypothetical protein
MEMLKLGFGYLNTGETRSTKDTFVDRLFISFCCNPNSPCAVADSRTESERIQKLIKKKQMIQCKMQVVWPSNFKALNLAYLGVSFKSTVISSPTNPIEHNTTRHFVL